MQPDIIALGEQGGYAIVDISIHSRPDLKRDGQQWKLRKYTPLPRYMPKGSQVALLPFQLNGTVHFTSLAYIRKLAESAGSTTDLDDNFEVQVVQWRLDAALATELGALLYAGREHSVDQLSDDPEHISSEDAHGFGLPLEGVGSADDVEDVELLKKNQMNAIDLQYQINVAQAGDITRRNADLALMGDNATMDPIPSSAMSTSKMAAWDTQVRISQGFLSEVTAANEMPFLDYASEKPQKPCPQAPRAA